MLETLVLIGAVIVMLEGRPNREEVAVPPVYRVSYSMVLTHRAYIVQHNSSDCRHLGAECLITRLLPGKSSQLRFFAKYSFVSRKVCYVLIASGHIEPLHAKWSIYSC